MMKPVRERHTPQRPTANDCAITRYFMLFFLLLMPFRLIEIDIFSLFDCC